MPRPSLTLPPRPPSKGYERTPREMQTYVPDHAAVLPDGGAPKKKARAKRARAAGEA